MTGFTYYEYLTSARISYACQLLLLNYSVQETCYMAGLKMFPILYSFLKNIRE